MKKTVIFALLLSLALTLAACASAPAETTAPETTAPATESTEKPLSALTAGDPLSTGSGCQPSADDFAE